MTDVSVLAPRWEVEWAAGVWSDESESLASLDVRHGSAAFGNPDRPVLQPAFGAAQAYGAVPAARRAGRFRTRVSYGASMVWQGWISEPDTVPGPRPITRWVLSGGLAEPVERRRSVARSPQTAAGLLSDVGLWARLIGAAPTVRGVPARRLGRILADQQVGGFVSRAAAVTSTIPIEARDGALVFAAPFPADPPANPARLDSSRAIIAALDSVDRDDRVRNSATVTVPDSPGAVTSHRQVVAVQALAPSALPPAGVEAEIALADTGAVSDLAAAPAGPMRMWIWEGEWRLVAVGAWESGRPPQPYAAPAPSARLAGRTAVVAQAMPPAAGRYGPLRTIGAAHTGWSPWAAFGARTPATTAEEQSLYGFERDIAVTWTRTAPATVTEPVTVSDDASVLRWGERRLDIPDWLASGTDLSAVVAQLAVPQRQHTVEMPVPQASPAPLGVDAGDYIALRIADAPRSADVDAVCLVAERQFSWRPATGGMLRLRCLETRAAAPAPQPARLLAESGSALLAEDGSAILLDAA